MPFVPIPKDLSKVKTKIALNLTKRQLICFSIGGAIGIPLYFLTRSLIGNSTAALMMIVVMFPFFFLAMYEKDGQPAERIFINMLRVKFAWPGKRPYKTENLYDYLEKEGNAFANQEKKPSTGEKPSTAKNKARTTKKTRR